ncbi:GTPase-binding protein rid1 [Zymoseptoria brevis]|uniref:GTPase-binding protein rid1 n=1 Tax=Zymoseptoria brevis TaxID=1047168 RepID=A0A0F4GFF3_9PEZI|nr:GTPase-binding protein rid1 [Zymoseptoria brevis]
MDTKSPASHRRNASSRSGLLRSLVYSKSRQISPESSLTSAHSHTRTVPLRPADDSQGGSTRGVLGERQNNVQSPPSSPSKSSRTDNKSTSKNKTVKDGLKTSKSSSNLTAVFARLNRSSKDLSTTATMGKDKENKSPPNSSDGQVPTPIWAQFASPNSRPESSDSKSSRSVRDEIARYTPQEYSPSKQRNFNGTVEQPTLRPTLGKARPRSAYFSSEAVVEAFGRRVSGDRPSMDVRRSEDSGRRTVQEQGNGRASVEKSRFLRRNAEDRKTSGSSAEDPAKAKLSIAKRGGRVMAAVAAFQGKTNEDKSQSEKKEAPLNPKTVEEAFENVLVSRNIPEPMRQKMRTLTLRVKADFVRQDQEATKTARSSPVGTLNGDAGKLKGNTAVTEEAVDVKEHEEDDSKSTKRSRPRSRTFTFSRGDRKDKSEGSPAKKPRSQSKGRPTSIHIPKEGSHNPQSTPTTPISGSFGRKAAPPANPADYITYLRKHQDPTKVEVGRLHKLRILLRNETVAWVDSFISQSGMSEIIGLLNRIMAIEWREEHEDQLLHETLLCLKGLCTTERAMAELDQVADDLFPALLAMLFDDEKKGPAEYSTRTIIINILFTFLSTATDYSMTALEHRSRRILAYLSARPAPESDLPVAFVLTMHTPRPYKNWSREVSNVTKEVFWIFLHHLNVVPLPRPTTSGPSESSPDRADILAATYTQRHFPGTRPPVPAAPYTGGVEWDATTYITAHLDLLNGLIASLPTSTARNDLRRELQASGFEKVCGAVLRTCKEKFYSGVHDGLRAWVAAASQDDWDTRFVREGPTDDEVAEQAMRARSSSPKKKKKGDDAPKLEEVKTQSPRLDLDLDGGRDGGDDDGWLG